MILDRRVTNLFSVGLVFTVTNFCMCTGIAVIPLQILDISLLVILPSSERQLDILCTKALISICLSVIISAVIVFFQSLNRLFFFGMNEF